MLSHLIEAYDSIIAEQLISSLLYQANTISRFAVYCQLLLAQANRHLIICLPLCLKVEFIDADFTIGIEADLHLLTLLVINLGRVPPL
jgi:hypothetical protein